MPVFPPIPASTMPASDVGIAYQFIPLNHVAAANPATSVVAPPPNPIMASVLSIPADAAFFQISSKNLEFFWLSPFGVESRNKFFDSFNLYCLIREAGANIKTLLWPLSICLIALEYCTPISTS